MADLDSPLVGIDYMLKPMSREDAKEAPAMIRILFNLTVKEFPMKKSLVDEMIYEARKAHPKYFEPVLRSSWKR